jgi:hypothetical protein
MNDCKDKELCKDIRMKDVRKTWGGRREGEEREGEK